MSTNTEQTSALRMSPISKTFGGNRALRDVAISIGRGEIVGLIGPNGCGKSTLIKHLSGYHTPDQPGWVQIGDRREALPVKPEVARQLGLSFVHQDLGLLHDASILDNLRVGRYATSGVGNILWRSEREAAQAALREFDIHVDPRAPLSELSNVERAIIALVRSFMDLAEVDGGVLVLDEPTAFLAQDDVSILFTAMRSFAAKGVGLLLVSHRLDEVLDVTDRVLVMRDGSVVADAVTAETSEDELVSLLLGQALDAYYPSERPPLGDAATMLELRGLSAPGLKPLDLSVRAGEIIGLTGLRAMGFEAVPAAAFGAGASASGQIVVDGTVMDAATLSPRQAMDAGVAMLPADRKRASGAQEFSLFQNMSLTKVADYFRRGILDKRHEVREAERLASDFLVKTESVHVPLSALSGGNQQKALLAKWFQLQPKVLVLHEPTAGVDVGAKKEIFARITQLADAGATVVLVSEEFADLAALCNRVLTFHDGVKNPNELQGADLSEGSILAQCYRSLGEKPDAAPGGAQRVAELPASAVRLTERVAS